MIKRSKNGSCISSSSKMSHQLIAVVVVVVLVPVTAVVTKVIMAVAIAIVFVVVFRIYVHPLLLVTCAFLQMYVHVSAGFCMSEETKHVHL